MKFARSASKGYIMQDGNLQITTEGVECRLRAGDGMCEGTPVEVQPQGFHRAAVVRLPGAARAPEEELSRAGGALEGLPPLVCRYRAQEGARSQHAVPGAQAIGETRRGGEDVGSIRADGPEAPAPE